MTASAVLSELTGMLCRLCEQDRLQLSPDTHLADIPGLDSLRLLQAAALLEERFQVEIDVVALENLHRVSDVLALIADAQPPYRWLSFPRLPLDHRGPTGFGFEPFGPAGARTPLLESLRRQADIRPDALACNDETNALTFAELRRAISNLAQAIPPDDGGPVAIVLPNGIGSVVASFACLAAGRLAMPIPPGSPLADRLEQAGATAVIGPPGLATSLPVIPIDSAFEGDTASIPHGLPIDAPAFLHPTSGSSGELKLLVHSQRSVLHRFQALADACHFGPDDRLLSFGNTPGIWTWCTPVTGCGLTLLPASAGYRRLFAILRETPVTLLRATPTLVRSLLTLPDTTQALKRLRLIYLYGEAVSRADIAALAAHLPHCLLLNAYGATEAGGLHWFARPDDTHDPNLAAVGLPWPETDVALLDDELVLRGPAAALGEWRDGRVVPGPCRPDPNDPDRRIWHTGDLGFQAPDGAIVVLGRRDRMVKLNGIRVEPAAVEVVLRAVPGVAEGVALTRVHADGRAQLAAFVVAEPATPPGLAERIRAAVSAALPAQLQPNPLICLDALPRLPSGKRDEQNLWSMLGR
jgi:acyl-coenzyme A synthetase/AMP-(fatty) acid ligase/acyl carrier protein